jgi:hypothetical protein
MKNDNWEIRVAVGRKHFPPPWFFSWARFDNIDKLFPKKESGNAFEGN